MTLSNINLGYACINEELKAPLKKGRRIIRDKITTNRSMILRTFNERGLSYVSELALKNCLDLEKIIQWNEDHEIKFFRMSSELFPWATKYNFEDLPDWQAIQESLQRSGELATKYSQRLTFHPGPFNKLASPKKEIVANTIDELNYHGKVMDVMGLSRTPYNKINIHVGGAYGDRMEAMKRFVLNFKYLDKSVQTRLTVENDDIESLFSVSNLMFLASEVGTPIVFDYHHHKFRPDKETEFGALSMAATTWHGGITPVVHYSQSRATEQNDPKIKPNAHSDSYWEPFEDYGYTLDVMLECKSKEKGLFKMRQLLKERSSKEEQEFQIGDIVKNNFYLLSEIFLVTGINYGKRTCNLALLSSKQTTPGQIVADFHELTKLS